MSHFQTNSIHLFHFFFPTPSPQNHEEILFRYIHTLIVLLSSPNSNRRITYKQIFFWFLEKLPTVITLPLTTDYFFSLSFQFAPQNAMLDFQSFSLIAQDKSVCYFTYSMDNKNCDPCSSVQEQGRSCTASLSLHWHSKNKNATHHLTNANPKPALQLFVQCMGILRQGRKTLLSCNADEPEELNYRSQEITFSFPC